MSIDQQLTQWLLSRLPAWKKLHRARKSEVDEKRLGGSPSLSAKRYFDGMAVGYWEAKIELATEIVGMLKNARQSRKVKHRKGKP
jgi:hypothetical protein